MQKDIVHKQIHETPSCSNPEECTHQLFGHICQTDVEDLRVWGENFNVHIR